MKRQAAAVYSQVRAFVEVSAGNTVKLTREQKGRFVALCRIVQIHRHIEDPKPAYVADGDGLPQWQQQTDADIFERIEDGRWLAVPGSGRMSLVAHSSRQLFGAMLSTADSRRLMPKV